MAGWCIFWSEPAHEFSEEKDKISHEHTLRKYNARSEKPLTTLIKERSHFVPGNAPPPKEVTLKKLGLGSQRAS